MNQLASLIVLVVMTISVSPAFAQTFVKQSHAAAVSCSSQVAIANLDTGTGEIHVAREGDVLCVLSLDGEVVCGEGRAAASASYTCPTNGNGVDCATECGDCAKGTGTVADCKACCDHFHSGASAISCKRHYC